MGVWLVLLVCQLLLGSVAEAAPFNSCVGCHEPCQGYRLADSEIHAAAENVCVTCHQGNPLTRRKELAHHFLIDGAYAWYRLPQSEMVQNGQKLVEQLGCRRCHVQRGKGRSLATSLDSLFYRATVAEIENALQQPAYYMPDFLLSQAALHGVIAEVLAAGLVTPVSEEQPPAVIYFEDESEQTIPFVKHCGACHRTLTSMQGGLGQGEKIAPNLSGLLSAFYPPTFKDRTLWDVDGLRKWLKNPRRIRPLSLMPPLRLSDQQMNDLIDRTWPPRERKEKDEA